MSMDDSNAIFVRAMPTIEIVGGNVFIGTAKGTFALPVSQYRLLHDIGAIVLAEHAASIGENVVPACRLCQRRGH
jgi:hypothetical protein